MRVSGVTDITSSEGKLRRFTLICILIGREKRLNKRELYDFIAADVGIGNRHVIERHLVLLERLGMIDSLDSQYVLTSEGKALFELASGKTSLGFLIPEERILYLKAFLASTLKQQIVELLKITKESPTSRRDLIRQYFQTDTAQGLWNKETIRRNLTRLEATGGIPSFFAHKFGCMEMWLQDLGLLRIIQGSISLAPRVAALVGRFEREDVESGIYKLAATAFGLEANEFDRERDMEQFLTLFTKSYDAFMLETKTSDIRAIRTCVCVRLLLGGLALEEEEFDAIIESLVTKGIVRSVMLGRDGRPANVTLAASFEG